jgi:hypothetical protein
MRKVLLFALPILMLPITVVCANEDNIDPQVTAQVADLSDTDEINHAIAEEILRASPNNKYALMVVFDHQVKNLRWFSALRTISKLIELGEVNVNAYLYRSFVNYKIGNIDAMADDFYSACIYGSQLGCSSLGIFLDSPEDFDNKIWL